ncbi:MAG: ATP-binding cassette domain-containing protein [Flavobacteriales bacterium]|nr:ATP-binding cassette domain-containing protein [Flavobacteriales bacterium]
MFRSENITKRYANHLALDEVSITVEKQSIFGLLGPNGAGKTSLIRIINQITAPDSGTAYFNGEPLSPEHIGRIGYLPEERGLYKKMKVGEQALYLARLKGLEKRVALQRLKEWFVKFEIEGWWNKKVEELSKGMQQKIQFIITVLHEPELLIFDEPFSGFDPINTDLIKNEILALRDRGTTIIFSTHNMESVEELCDHIALIDNSKKILDGKLKDIRASHRSNTYKIGFRGGFQNLKKGLNGHALISEENEDEVNKAKIKLADGSSLNTLLQALIPHVELEFCTEEIPSIRDIFIEQVSVNKGR